MMTHEKQINPLCPKGHRHLLTMHEVQSEAEARAELVDMYGDRGKRARLVRGVFAPDAVLVSEWDRAKWKVFPLGGWTAFILKSKGGA